MRYRTLGVLFLTLVLVGVYCVYAIFAQKFTSFTDVALHADNSGLQLPDRADVKVRGDIVGEVRKVVTDKSGGVTMTLGLQPDKAKQIPANVSASILPKTLFGEKYVSLDIPSRPSTAPLRTGDKITQTKLPIEVEQVLNDIYPLLRTVQPVELNYTLTALATALEGRGNQIGENLQVLNNYLIKMNPKVPKLIADLKLLTSVSNTYADVAPELGRILRNTVKTGNTLLTKQQRLHQFLQSTTAFSNTATGFLNANGDNIVQLGQLSEPTVALLQKYSSEFPCMLQGIVNQAPKLGSTFRGFIFHINLLTIPKQPRQSAANPLGNGYGTADVPVYADTRGPYCGKLPNPPWNPSNPFTAIPNFNDGVAEGNNDLKRVAPSVDSGATSSSTADSGTTTATAANVSGNPAEKALMTSLAAPVLGVPADQVGDVTTLLFGPLARGSQVDMEASK
ncbi:MCE family protein [Nocardioides mangrovicus]|uniref:MCE family protein n=1 Tax=Nocardioides mangrovicus TaxID=2478913 RepID=UPI001313EA04|nr:MCE family protein [Nocardioides mangrovicus]